MTAPEIRLDPITESAFPEKFETVVAGYAEQNVSAGTWAADEAIEKARAACTQLLPDGFSTPDNFLSVASDAASGEQIGFLWLALRRSADKLQAFIYDIEVGDEFRGRGYGRAIMLACVDQARGLGAGSVGLHVFGNNTVARSLYTSLGFVETNVVMSLQL